MENDKIIIKSSDGTIKEYSLLSRFKIDGKDDEYALFTDYSLDENQNFQVFSGILNKDGTVKSIESPEEISLINDYIQNLFESV